MDIEYARDVFNRSYDGNREIRISSIGIASISLELRIIEGETSLMVVW